ARVALVFFGVLKLVGSSCVETGTAYKDPFLPAPGLFVAAWEDCQTKCKQDPLCKTFTFKKDTLPAGGCWLISTKAQKEADSEAVSGPKECPQATVVTDHILSPEVPEIEGKSLVAPAAAGNNQLYAIVGGSLGAALLAAGGFYFMGGAPPAAKKKRGLPAPGEPKKAWQLYAKMANPDATFDLETGDGAPPAMPPVVEAPYYGAGLQLGAPPVVYYSSQPQPASYMALPTEPVAPLFHQTPRTVVAHRA
ncbi:unnamed protein product, partial [Durusdinium trenchii]